MSGVAPLRAVVDSYLDDLGLRIEVLECGHEQRAKRDIYGETVAVRRRCRKCRDAEGSQ